MVRSDLYLNLICLWSPEASVANLVQISQIFRINFCDSSIRLSQLWEHLYRGGTPENGPIGPYVNIICLQLQEVPVPNLVQLSQCFRINCCGSFIWQSRLWDPFCMGSTPENGPIGLIFELDLPEITRSIFAKFGSIISIFSHKKLRTNGQTDMSRST